MCGLQFGVNFGIAPKLADDGSFRFEAEAAGPLVFITTLAVDGPIIVGEPDSAPREFRRYNSGDLARLLREGKPGTYLLKGPPPLEKDADIAQEIDMGQLEALRALGYLGDEE